MRTDCRICAIMLDCLQSVAGNVADADAQAAVAKCEYVVPVATHVGVVVDGVYEASMRTPGTLRQILR